MIVLHDMRILPNSTEILPLTLTADKIQVWQFDLCLPPERLMMLAATLSANERARASRFRLSAHQNRFIAARGLLRELLGTYLHRPATALRFGQGPHGKPLLIGKEASAGLYFNLSHSGNRALYVLAQQEVGVDIEYFDRKVDYLAVAAQICTTREQAMLQAQSSTQLPHAFFTCWTRKEALAKALGSGLTSDLHQFDVCSHENVLSPHRTSLRDTTGQEWSVLNIPMEPGWFGAVAAAGTDWQPYCHWEVA
ncbi:MAG: hypothetical protein CSA09_02825 [Candidatus Contendobacter odensis]|uniref:Uncharacterized protein n=1 Tax=Candidatus Contendibacter odensensis TaxID=1400860 RepID=A0A2G6PFF4_9GAMM|nr:MAG: hypothetical protein CSA09_02825 [Candidatus Contendobacter odensis]